MTKKQGPLKVRTTVRSIVVEYEGDDPAELVQLFAAIAHNLGFLPPPDAPECGQ